MHTSNTDHDETLKEQIETILDTCIFTALDAEMHSTATSVATNRILDMLGEDRERAVNAGRIEELEKLITLNKTLYGVEAEMTRRANNRLAELSNPSQTKKTK
jgi:hypothetical protein